MLYHYFSNHITYNLGKYKYFHLQGLTSTAGLSFRDAYYKYL